MEKQQRDFLFSKRFIFSAFFTLGLISFEFFYFSQEYESLILFQYFESGNYFSPSVLLALTAATFLLIGFFIWAALASPYRFRVFYFALFCLGVATEYGYQDAFNRFTDLGDAANALFAADTRIRLNAIAEYFNCLAIIPCFLFGLLLIFVKPLVQKGLPIFLTVLFAVVVFFALTAYFTSNIFHTISLGGFYRTAVSFPVNFYLGSQRQPSHYVALYAPRQKIKFRAQTSPKNNIVFIVDESIRGDHLSLNGYGRKTTPLLDELNQKGFIKNWGVAVSGTTCSRTSNNLLLTGVTDLPDTKGEIYSLPTIFQYAKAMNYKTFYFDGQVSNLWNGKPTDAEDFDEWITADILKKETWYEVDAEIARRVKVITENSTGNFIWINKFGAHKPYNDSYPGAEAKWLPVAQDDDSSTLYRDNIDREMIINNYNNAIRYNLQSFFGALFENRPAANTFYIYTSDHGQSLNENGTGASHCSTSKNEANVPLLILADPQILPVADTGYRASHSNIFSTLLDLMSFPETERRATDALSLFKAKAANSKRRFYFAGDLHSLAADRKFAFDE